MFLVLFSELRRKFAEKIPFRGLEAQSLRMVHRAHPMSSVSPRRNVSCGSPGSCSTAHDSLIFEIEHPELVLRTVEQHPQVVAVHPKRATDVIFILLLQEDGAKQLPVSLRQLTKYTADVLLEL